eukprot:GHVR01028813.1.p3 GENE.GHVR01028813.1~~GHVR01028813.1.p3  ORF type:complete len:101 (-),score=5.89 GHVR01028813.1:2274-2576(-)
MLPTESDHKMFVIGCKQGKEEEMTFCILNKGSYYAKTKNPKYRVAITSVLSLKKKYPGKIFIEAQCEKDIRDSLEGFIDINLHKIQPLDHESYSNLFVGK